VQKQTMGEVGN